MSSRVRLSFCTALAVFAAQHARGQFPPIVDLAELTPDQGVVFLGEVLSAATGYQVGAGDLNADGANDVMISAPLHASMGLPGTVYVVFGGPTLLGRELVDLATLASPDGFVVEGPLPGSNFGQTIVTDADFNGDGIDDMAVGSPGSAPPGGVNNGQVFVVFGEPGIGAEGYFDLATLGGTNGFVINGKDSHEYLGLSGLSLASIGALDFNGDGYLDLPVQAMMASAPGRPGIGQAYVIFGGPDMGAGGVLDVADLDGTNGVTINGLVPGGGLGEFMVGGDVNGDGLGDLLFGLPGYDAPGRVDSGATYVLFGGTPPGPGGIIELADVPGNAGYVIYGPEAEAFAGYCDRLGDVNGDGVDDVIINTGGSGTGFAYIVFGGPDVGASGVFDLADLDGTNGFVIENWSIRAVGDLNDDGFADLGKSAPMTSPAGRFLAGIDYVAYGHEDIGAGGVFEIPQDPAEDEGFVIWGPYDWANTTVRLGLADISGDNVDELVLRAGQERPDGEWVHAVYVVFGRSVYALGDIDRDFDVDISDFWRFAACFAGADNPPAAGCPPGVDADFDNDLDVDLSDFAIFAQNFTGAR